MSRSGRASRSRARSPRRATTRSWGNLGRPRSLPLLERLAAERRRLPELAVVPGRLHRIRRQPRARVRRSRPGRSLPRQPRRARDEIPEARDAARRTRHAQGTAALQRRCARRVHLGHEDSRGDGRETRVRGRDAGAASRTPTAARGRTRGRTSRRRSKASRRATGKPSSSIHPRERAATGHRGATRRSDCG